MRRVILLITMIAAARVLGSGIALAVNKVGTQGRDFLKGTDKADNVFGRTDELGEPCWVDPKKIEDRLD